ncbi:hypothetical protein L917_19731 [Phytophthora nicotianae]|uniref:BED-type domain-containing protein n=1 Tax=Phytophthora nicotianae TaxID=4792 RepID=W2MBL3_PHYNI|nr:hypothetical protein L917_19731 [Phytophthora nicotianae]ETM32929.1 hypothetical protein L914_19774 [Phytophthora nicotianae]
MSYTSPSQPSTRPSKTTRRVGFSPQPPSSTPSRPPRSGPDQATSAVSGETGRSRDELWQHYDVERENGKKHGRCKYCGILKKNGMPGVPLMWWYYYGQRHLQCQHRPKHILSLCAAICVLSLGWWGLGQQ